MGSSYYAFQKNKCKIVGLIGFKMVKRKLRVKPGFSILVFDNSDF
jgi:hypothetical protein